MAALNTDLYELTMAAGYVAAGETQEIGVFELSVRRLSEHRNYLLAAGLQQAVEYLQALRFEPEEIAYLRSLSQLRYADAPALGAVYKLMEIQHDGQVRYTAKYSSAKSTLPGVKQILRRRQDDLRLLSDECGEGIPLLLPVLISGELVEPLPTAAQIRSHAAENIARLPDELKSIHNSAAYPVRISRSLTELTEQVRREHVC